MRINGRWFQCPDRIVRPILSIEVLAGDGAWQKADFMEDTGADCSVFTANLLDDLSLPCRPAAPLAGVGGAIPSVLVTTKIRLRRDDGGSYTIQSPFAGFTDPLALEMSVLGRDILDLFAVIVDRPGNVVCLLAPRHQYAVVVV